MSKMIVDEKRRKQLKSDLAKCYSEDEIELLIAAANSAEKFAFYAITKLDGWLEELGPDRPSPMLAYELAKLQLDAAIRPVYDARPGYGCSENAWKAWKSVYDDVDLRLCERFSWVPRKLAEHVLQAEQEGTYKFLKYLGRE